MPELKAIHICNSRQPPHKPKIAKEYVLPTLKSGLNNKHRKIKLNEKSTTYNTVYN
jgi:hypothetical protein